MAERLVINNQNAAHVQAYINYYNTVGNADDGKPFTEKQYEEFKTDLKKNAKNRLYTTWRSNKGVDCKNIGPSAKCFCDHRYKDHNYLNPVDKKVHCKAKGCPCPTYYYVPVHGSQDFKCLCKHSYTEHDPITKKCVKGQCGCNVRFSSAWSCTCHLKFGEHKTVFETREERIALGKPVEDFDVPEGGGMGNFSSLVEGAESFGYQAQQMALEQGQNKKMIQGGPSSGYSAKVLPIEESKGKSSRLASLNQKITMEKKINAIESGAGFNQGGEDESEEDGPDEEITALELFNTPHQFVKAKVGMNIGKRQVKY